MYPAEEDFGLDHPISTILPDYPALYDDYEYDDYILLPLTLPGVLIPSPGLPEEPYGLYSEVRRHHTYLWPSYPDVAQDLLSPPPQYNFVVSEFDDDDDEPLLSTVRSGCRFKSSLLTSTFSRSPRHTPRYLTMSSRT